MTVVEQAPPNRESLHIIDGRTGAYYSIPIQNNAIKASDLKKVTAPEDEAYPANQTENGLRVYDPGYSNTAVSHSKITYIDGLKGTIQYRGYSINDIVGRKTFIDTAHLLIWGHWPSAGEAETLQQRLDQVPVPQDFVFNVIKSFPRDGSLMGMVIAGLSALQSSDMEAIPAHVGKTIYLNNPELADQQIIRVMSSMSMLTAAAYCHHIGRDFTPPRSGLSYIENFLLMTGHVEATTGLPNPRYVNAIERLWVLIADHEMTCSTAALLQTASALPDVISCMVSAISALYGPLHGGAIEVAYKNIESIGSLANVPAKIARVKAGKERLYGYGHRVYRVTDPRFVFIREILNELSEEVEKDPLLKVAFEVDRVASEDEYFTSRNLRPNADLFAAFVYKALGFPPEFILPLSILSRTQGFMAHWREAMGNPPRIWRPGQIYTGDLNKSMDE
ncbi:citrate synthase [Aspergillus bombycis]|uniref:Citrate synthase n=1 Tax=Aspergillus bombycis TaxID=109264 RepID=A0A1F7ZS17_9EURO|nr:citrate synthase [Aspergillus bombycis]OGM42234.1 citrate synthase [Aspergillus bombycis]